MNANDVIASYVADVALQLPRKQRNDVAFELRALLHEELEARAEGAGRGADAAMATELVRAFGRPADVAARYRPTLTIIEPADGQAFLRATVFGLVIIWSLGLWVHLGPAVASGGDVLTALGQWWGTTVIPSLWWPGLLVVNFGAAAWARRHWPQASEWKPRVGERSPAGRVATVMGIVGIVCGVLVLLEPRWILDLFFGGRAAPAAYDALTYTDTFRHRQAPYLLLTILFHVPMLFTAVVSDRWSGTMQRNRGWLGLLTCAVMTWTVLDGPVLVAPTGDRMVKSAMVIIVAITLIDLGVRLYRRVRPAPTPLTPA